MPVVISLLRGINLGPHNRIAMADLKAIYESAGIRNPQTYVQSGNVVFDAAPAQLDALTRKLQNAMREARGFSPEIVYRTLPELRAVVAANPFARRSGIEPSRLLVTFFALEQDAGAPDRIAAIKTDPEEMHLVGRELFIYYPQGMGRSKLPLGQIAKVLAGPSTARNWNTVMKLLAMAAAWESPDSTPRAAGTRQTRRKP